MAIGRTCIPVAAAMLAALSACNGGSEPAAVENNLDTAAIENVASQVAALPAGQRDGVFIRAIRDAGLSCQGVTGSERTDAPGTWVATCTDGSRHTIAFRGDGMAQVTSITPQR